MRTIALLVLSNVFMTFAWYGHLFFKHRPILVVIAASWLIALPEYALQVPANRLGHGTFTLPQLKIIQEVISVSVFVMYSLLIARETPKWNDWISLGLIVAAVAVAVGPDLWKGGGAFSQSSAGVAP